jgi:hypothetical protein
MPTSESLKKLSLNDIAIMSSLGHSFKSNLGKYVQIDPFTVPDPFDEKDNYNYSIIVDREEPNRIIALIASMKNSSLLVLWNNILDEHMNRLSLSKQRCCSIRDSNGPQR